MAGPIVLDDIERFGHFKEIHVKIDTEGYELEVLRGIQELLVAGRVKKLVVEVNDMHLQRFGADSASLYEFLEQFGYLPSMGLQSGHYDEVFFRS
ncbi:hypothetical protein ECTPHS_13642 [Ectothiorhodospira sp. PHS-1]|nr:hypothetical protein ECTPHS_13642 [Ectothiorhodospira sp. PHS-1]